MIVLHSIQAALEIASMLAFRYIHYRFQARHCVSIKCKVTCNQRYGLSYLKETPDVGKPKQHQMSIGIGHPDLQITWN